MKSVTILALALFLMFTASAQAAIVLYADQDMAIGTVDVAYDGVLNELTVAFDTTGSYWYMTETHVQVFGDNEPFRGITLNRGNPAPRQFMSTNEGLIAQIDEHVINLGGLGLGSGDQVFVAAHAIVSTSRRGARAQNAWAAGGTTSLNFPGKNWATYFCAGTLTEVWDVRGDWAVAVTVEYPDVGGPYAQFENITAQDFVAGGLGGAGGNGLVAWDTVGNVTGDLIAWSRPNQSSPPPPYLSTFVGAIAPDGSMGGVWSDNSISPHVRWGYWSTPADTAERIVLLLP